VRGGDGLGACVAAVGWGASVRRAPLLQFLPDAASVGSPWSVVQAETSTRPRTLCLSAYRMAADAPVCGVVAGVSPLRLRGGAPKGWSGPVYIAASGPCACCELRH